MYEQSNAYAQAKREHEKILNLVTFSVTMIFLLTVAVGIYFQ
jgi:hypothetical protein